VLLSLVALQFMLPAQDDQIAFVPGRSHLPSSSEDGASLSIADPAILQNAMFAPARAAGGTSASSAALDGARLVGVVRANNFARAVMQSPDGETNSVTVGGLYRGWRLASLSGDSAVFIRDGIRHNATIARGAIETVSSFQPRPLNEQ
jgi:hypothetical protein